MPLFQFSDLSLPLIKESVARASILNDEERRIYATELLDTYKGFGQQYLESLINRSITSEQIKRIMVNLKMPFPILTSFIDSLSMVYKDQPKRNFLLNGKILVEDLPEGEFIDKKKYIVNKDLAETLGKIYNREFCLRIKEAEEFANLLNTVIYKINNREGELKLDFIPNDAAVVRQNPLDSTQMDQIYFMIGSATLDTNIIVEYERWNLIEFEKTNSNEKQEKILMPNRAEEELKKYTNNMEKEHIGSGFPPFVVIRDNLPTDNFWNISDKDTIDIIKQINLALTEIRYLQRFGSFGLKYLINAKLPTGTAIDAAGIWELTEESGSLPGISKKVEVGELKNEARIEALTESVFQMLRFLFTLKGINSEGFISSKQKSTAESKEIDREGLKEYISKQQEIWHLNEEYIFYTAIVVYNRDNSNKIPKGLEIKIDYPDVEASAEEMEKKINNWIVMIDNNFKTSIDFIQEDNPDLTKQEATLLFEQNKAFNKAQESSMPLSTTLEDDNIGEDEDEENG